MDFTSIIIKFDRKFLSITVAFTEGETLIFPKVTRSEMGAYLCIASNGVPPSVSKRMMLHVHCKFNNISYSDFIYTLGNIQKLSKNIC